MNDNPFRAPESLQPTLNPDQLNHAKISAIARYQRGVMICILLYLVAFFAQLSLPEEQRLWVGLGILAVGVFGLIFVLMLALQLYSTPVAILFGIGTLIPCLGLLVLLIINQKATSVLRKNGLRVGLLGANAPAEQDRAEL
jgi:hypothetical protein